MVKLNKFYSFSSFVNESMSLKARFPSILQVTCLGQTWENRPILMFVIGNGPEVLAFSSGVHGRESINPVVMLKIIEDCCYYPSWYFEKYTLYILPLINPDGYVAAMECGYRKWKGNGRGVDINRNFPSASWQRKFQNDVAASEPETKALIKFFDRYEPLYYLDFHSRGNEIYYHRRAMDNTYNENQRQLALKLCEITGYLPVDPGREMDEINGGGNTVHYFSEEFNRPAITIETVEENAKFPMDVKYQSIVYNQIKNIAKGAF